MTSAGWTSAAWPRAPNTPDGQQFNIYLDEDGDLHFKANGKNGGGTTRMIIRDSIGEVTVGGSGQFGQLQLKSAGDDNTIFIGGSGSEATMLLGGAGAAQHAPAPRMVSTVR